MRSFHKFFKNFLIYCLSEDERPEVDTKFSVMLKLFFPESNTRKLAVIDSYLIHIQAKQRAESFETFSRP